MRFLSCAIHRPGDGKSVLSERAASSKMELFMGAWGQRPQQATWDLRASENPRFGLGGSHEALLAGFSYPVFMPFRAVFLQMRKEDAYTSSFSSSASFNLMAPSMTPSTRHAWYCAAQFDICKIARVNTDLFGQLPAGHFYSFTRLLNICSEGLKSRAIFHIWHITSPYYILLFVGCAVNDVICVLDSFYNSAKVKNFMLKVSGLH